MLFPTFGWPSCLCNDPRMQFGLACGIATHACTLWIGHGERKVNMASMFNKVSGNPMRLQDMHA